MALLERERENVAAASRRLAAEGLVTASAGNVSQRSGELVAVTPAGSSLGELAAEDVAVVDLDGQRATGALPPTSELALHLAIYRRFGAGAVVHAHAPVATALSCVLDELPVVHYGMVALGGSVRVAPYATFGSTELAERTLVALEGRRAALMANHGTVSFGADLDDAVQATELLEWASTVYWHAAAIGRPRILDAEQRAAAIRRLETRDIDPEGARG